MYTRTLLTDSHTDTDADCMNVCVYISSGLVQRQGTTAPKCPQVYHSKKCKHWVYPTILDKTKYHIVGYILYISRCVIFLQSPFPLVGYIGYPIIPCFLMKSSVKGKTHIIYIYISILNWSKYHMLAISHHIFPAKKSLRRWFHH